MSKVKNANERVMYDYLNELLHPIASIPDETPTQKKADATGSTKAISDVAVNSAAVESETHELTGEDASVSMNLTDTTLDVGASLESPAPVKMATASVPEEPFQALYFEVAGLTMAVPLTQLGGIHNLSERNHLLGKPDWFDGVMVHREERYNVVDTARWVMPERYQQIQSDLNYQYLIMLEDSGWGLMCDRLITTEALSPDDVKWSKPNGKRGWLAGLVKEKKCALIEVSELIKLLNLGLNCNG